jgi:tetratricopeptide (TPR) repeat protein
VQEERRRQEHEQAAQVRAAEEAMRQAEEKFAAVEQLTDFDEAHALGVAASNAPSSDHPLAIAALKKAYRLDPRRKVRAGREPDPGLFEVPMKLAAAYRRNGQYYESQKMYEWVLKHHDSRIARTELGAVREEMLALAAVHEVNCKRSEALKLYEELVHSDPHDMRALRGVARMLVKLGRGVETREAYNRVRRASRG